MSFSQEVKAQICEEELPRNCCAKAFVTGVLVSKATVVGKDVSVNIYGAAAADYIGHAIFTCYGQHPEVRKDKSSGVARTLVFSSAGAMRLLDETEGGGDEPLVHFRCPLCKSYFLRGLFLACGRVTDPTKQYSLEFSVGEHADAVERMLWSCDLTPKCAVRRKEKILFLSDVTSVEDFFVLANLNGFAFRVMNSRIDHDMTTQTVRALNCEMSNLNRAVSAAFRQAEMIQRLCDSGKLSLLPPDLAATAQARLDHREMDLTSLALTFTPPLSKSGLAHRLARIAELAEQILEEK